MGTNEEPLLAPLARALDRPIPALAAALVIAATLAYAWLYYPISQGHTGDFLALLSHRDHPEGWWDGQGVGYGPIFAAYDLALRGLRDREAMRLMFGLNIAMLIAALGIALLRFLPRPRSRGELLAAVLVWVSFYPTIQALRQNNVEITELLCLVLMLEALRRRRDGLAGILLGIAGATKILPFALLLYFAWRRRFLLVAASIATGIVLFVAIVLVKGETISGALSDWSQTAAVSSPIVFENNQALSGLCWRLFSDFDFSTRHSIEYPRVLDAAAARAATTAASIVLFLVVGGLVLRRTGLLPPRANDPRLESVEIAIVLTSMLVLLPRNHTHYFALIAWVFLGALREWPRPPGAAGRLALTTLVTGYALLGLLLAWRLLDPLIARVGLAPATGIDLARLWSLPLWGALSCLIALLTIHAALTPRTRA